ncbi:inner nuclear membrane protein Src1p [[Candida] railenensis]|uniref:Inner nuclear membrane protein Src1p n=1 Tax=[Candida] railenensis TaxID=45579 RepID=A0A9P0QKL8_9ASCO|nr:inner nuclear membrane protein Src1p [[Candida] railenensis]
MEDRQYLEKDFNPKSLTVAKLRGILNEYDVTIPSNAKKADLVESFNKHIAANAAELLRKHKADLANANGNGIVNEAESGSESQSQSDLESESEPDSEEQEEKPAKRQTRSSTPKPTPKSKMESKNENKKESEAKKGEDGSSPFSSENVFQSPPPTSTIPHKRIKSPVQATPSRIKMTKLSPKPKTPRGKLFEDDDESDKDDLFSSNVVRSPARKLASPAATKKSPVGTKSKIGKEKAKESEKVNAKQKEALEKRLEKQGKNDVIKNETEQFPSIDEQISNPVENFPTFDSLKPAPHSVSDLAKELGIVVQGVPPQSIAPKKESVASKKATPKKTPRLAKASPLSRGSVKNSPVEIKRGESTSNEKKVESSPITKKIESTPKKKPLEPANLSVSKHNNTDALLEHNLNSTQSDSEVALPIKKTLRKTSPLTIVTFIILWLSFFSVGLFGWWYREQTFLIGYCGQEIYQDTIPLDPQNTPVWLSSLGTYLDTFKPLCTPCPPHGRCFPLLELSCYNDFIDDQPWYFNLVPFPVDSKKCIPDTKKAEKLEIMIDVTLDLLRSRNAASNCGRNSEDDLTSGLSVGELHEMLLQMKAPYITKEEFEDLWNRSLIELEKEPEIITGFGVNNLSTIVHSNNTREEKEKNKVFRSTSLSHISLKCQISNTVIGSLNYHKFKLFTVILVLVLIQLGRYNLEQYRLYQKKVGTLYSEVLNKLRHQRKLGSAKNIPTYIGSTQLRDLILTREQNLNAKMKLWESVSKKVENNSNIRHSLQESHGEIMKVWEWITDVQ